MPSLREYKVALKGSSYAYLAGMHAVTQTVWQNRSERGDDRGSTFQELHEFLNELYDAPTQGADLAEILNEEGLYPFAEEWPIEGLTRLLELLKPPQLNEDDAFAHPPLFRFKKGFKKLLMTEARNRYALFDEETEVSRSHLDHWFSLVLNSAFYAGVVVACRKANESADFYTAMAYLEEESEPWTHYDQIARLFDTESSRPEEEQDYGYGSDSDDDSDFDRDDDYGSGSDYDD